VQGTAERQPFSETDLHQLLDLARRGTSSIFALQEEVLRATAAQAGETQ
jgi:ribonuclease PH